MKSRKSEFTPFEQWLSEGASWRPFMDKQNEGIKDPEVKEILYDMGG